MLSISCLAFVAFHILIDIFTVAIKNIINMHAVSPNQIADILCFNDNLSILINIYMLSILEQGKNKQTNKKQCLKNK